MGARSRLRASVGVLVACLAVQLALGVVWAEAPSADDRTRDTAAQAWPRHLDTAIACRLARARASGGRAPLPATSISGCGRAG